MRIAHVVSSLLAPLGGAEQYCLELARGQRDAGHDVTVLTGWATPSVVADLAAEGIAVRLVRSRRPYPPDRKGSRPAAALFHALDLLGSVVASRGMRRALAEPWDAVHVHRIAGFGAALLRVPAAPVVFTVHDYSLIDTSAFLLRDGAVPDALSRVQRMRTALIRRSLGRVHLVFPTERLRAMHARFGLDHPGTDSVVPHGWRLGSGAAVPTPAPDMRDAAAEPVAPEASAPVVLLFLGKLLTDKGIDLLLAAWGDGIPGAELRFAGAGPDAASVEAAAAAGRVRMLGWLEPDARAAALADADALVLPSLWPENFPLAAAEGVLAGLPIVSTTIAAPPVVTEGRNGLLAEATPEALRAALVRLLDPALRAALAAGARAAASDLDFGRHLARIEELYAPDGTAPGARVRGSGAAGGADAILPPTDAPAPARIPEGSVR